MSQSNRQFRSTSPVSGLGDYWWKWLNNSDSPNEFPKIQREREACLYSLLARDRKTGKWLNQLGETGPRMVGTFGYTMSQGLVAVVVHNPESFSEVVVKKIHLSCEGGGEFVGIPTIRLPKQETWLHMLVLPVDQPKPGTSNVFKTFTSPDSTYRRVWRLVELVGPSYNKDTKTEEVVDNPKREEIVLWYNESRKALKIKQEAMEKAQAMKADKDEEQPF